MKNSAVCSDVKMGDSAEESSWTFYIQGFICENDDQNSSFSSENESPSLVSDAASSAVKKSTATAQGIIGFSPGTGKPNNNNNNNNNNNRNINITCKQNSFKKQKTKVPITTDIYDLEDTASSPVNSPKISYMNQFMNQKEKGKIDVSEVKRNIFCKSGEFNVERDIDCTDLKKKNCN